ncbi:DUF3024 domain-containing protein [Vibrio renipiscarius]|uniref:DUF3024 domain-containing protein n=1 Tax=Vibrio renipiscarius TaxID=1461322 RepID=A0A0C2JKM0_9VIBR|nr:DUF3024 domain-containing protein [Vibrio renipiscarius]KII76148.1 hypothetical protein OJ16_15135 [Vibrio renipiscarius]KII78514.1 hypothetical protein PL18_12065 [Vibrio renipiscarius]
MSLVSLLQKQVETRAETICHHRNQNMPTALGGKADFESIVNGVIFFNQHYLLDSSHCDYTSAIAKVCWDDEQQAWLLFMIDEQYDDDWQPYPYLSQSQDLTAIMREIDKDPKNLFW